MLAKTCSEGAAVLLTNRRLSLLARACLFGAMAIIAAVTLGPQIPYQSVWLENAGALHAVFYYGLASLCFLAFPSIRRNDMAGLLVLFAGVMEVAQGAVGRGMHFQSLSLAALGVYAVILPGLIEQLRSLARSNPWASLPAAWREFDRRRPDAALAQAMTGEPAPAI
jgi:hypothetical protein